MPLYLALALLFGLFAASSASSDASSRPAGVSEPEDDEIRQVTAYALAHESDPALLSELASLLALAGYGELSKQITARRNVLSGAP